MLEHLRLHEKTESQFLYDRAKIVNSVSFRRLEYKTQVFVNHIGDHYRTRLTHTLEVAQIAKTIGRKLGLNEDYMEVLALAHDLGHPPFGHAGEDALNDATKSAGGFDHNAQTLRTVAILDHNSSSRQGLELSNETLIGIAKHNAIDKLHPKLTSLCAQLRLDLTSFHAIEIHLASLADDIAYISHDIEDGIRMGILDAEEVLEWPEIKALTHNFKFQEKESTILSKMICNKIKEVMTLDLINNIQSIAKQVNAAQEIHANFSSEIDASKDALKKHLMAKVYKHYQINRMRLKSNKVIKELFDTFKSTPECLPPKWQLKIEKGKANLHEVIVDYIAGMTDRFAIKEHRQLLDPSIY